MKILSRGTTFLLALISVASAIALLGCAKEEKPTDPGYYAGPMQKKGVTPGAAAAPGKSGATVTQ